MREPVSLGELAPPVPCVMPGTGFCIMISFSIDYRCADQAMPRRAKFVKAHADHTQIQ